MGKKLFKKLMIIDFWSVEEFGEWEVKKEERYQLLILYEIPRILCKFNFFTTVFIKLLYIYFEIQLRGNVLNVLNDFNTS